MRLNKIRQRPPDARLDNPKPEVLRRYILEQWCWWCGRGPWQSLAHHTSQAHGIGAREVREIAGLFRHATICADTHSEACSKRNSNMRNLALAKSSYKGIKKRMSEAGLQVQKESVQRLLSRPDAMTQRMNASRASALKCSKPHPCPACGKMMPFVTPKTCSPECRKAIRVETIMKINQKRRDA